jgi:roadblock/LC7 domain-containing protein
MSELSQLLKYKGVVGALRFYDDGTVAESIGEFEPSHLRLAADMCYANSRLMQQSADMVALFSNQKGWPPAGWIMMGEELSVCALEDMACFVRNKDVSYNQILAALIDINDF